MTTRAPRPTGQLMFGSVLILLTVLAVLLLFKWLGERPTGESRVDWPPSTGTTKP